MMAKAESTDELNDAMKRGESRIEIEGDLAKKVIRLKATGNVAWAIAIAAIGIAVFAAITIIPTTVATGGIALPVEGAVAAAFIGPAAALIGLDVTIMAVGLAIAAGGVGVLTRLRSNYKIVDEGPNYVVLAKL